MSEFSIGVSVEITVILSAFTFLVCQHELTKQLRAANSIHPFFAWLLVVFQWIVGAGLACFALTFHNRQELLWLSLLFPTVVIFLTIWQARIIRQKSDRLISIWRFASADLAQIGLLAGLIVAALSLPLIMIALNCAITSTIAITVVMSTITLYTSFGPLHSTFNPEIFHPLTYYTGQSHLPAWLTASIIEVSWCMTIGMTFVIIISGLEFIRFNAWRLYKGRLIAKLVEIEKRSFEASRPASLE